MFTLETTKVYYVTSSLGSLTFKLLFDFAQMFISDKDLDWNKLSNNKKKLTSMYNVIYPSKNYISGSFNGEKKTKCLFLN